MGCVHLVVGLVVGSTCRGVLLGYRGVCQHCVHVKKMLWQLRYALLLSSQTVHGPWKSGLGTGKIGLHGGANYWAPLTRKRHTMPHPTRQLLGSANAETTPARAQKVATRCNMRREERVTVQGPVKEQQPDGMSHRGGRSSGRGGGARKGALVTGQSQEASLKRVMMAYQLRREVAWKIFFSSFPPALRHEKASSTAKPDSH